MYENKKFHVIVDEITFRRAKLCAFRFFVKGVLYCVQRKRRVFTHARSETKIRRPGENNMVIESEKRLSDGAIRGDRRASILA